MRYFPPIFEFIILLALTPSLACAWQVTLNVTGTGTSDQAIFGSEDGSSNGVDSYDVPKSPAPPSPPYTRAYFYHSELTYPYDYMHADYRNATFESELSYNLSLMNAIGSPGEAQTVVLSWNASPVPSNFASVLLKDYNTNMTIDMRHFPNHTFSMPTDQVYKIQVVLNYTSVAPFALEEGWNLISLPLHPLNSSPTWVFRNVPGFILSRWNPSTQSYAQYYSGINCSLVECITEMIPSYGYWLFSPSQTGLSVEGTNVGPFSVNISLSEGWNMIGLPFFSIVNFTHIFGLYTNEGLGAKQVKNITQLEGIGAMLGYLFSYNAQSGTYDPLIDFPSGQLEQKRGYWLPSLSALDLWIPKDSEWSMNCTGFYPYARVSAPVNVTPSSLLNVPNSHGVVLEETVSNVLDRGFLNGTSTSLKQEVDFIEIKNFAVNESSHLSTESVILNPEKVTGEEIARLVYSEDNESDPHWRVELGAGFFSYQILFESSIPAFNDATSELYATFTNRIPNIPILGSTVPVYSINETHWSAYSGCYAMFEAVSDNNPPVDFIGLGGLWNIKVVDVFYNESAYVANLNVTHNGAYENYTHIIGEYHTYNLGGNTLMVHLDIALGSYASFTVAEGDFISRNMTSRQPWLNNSSWIIANISTSTLKLDFNSTKFLRDGLQASLNDYLNLTFRLWNYMGESLSFKASPSGIVDFEFSGHEISSDEIYYEFPNLDAAYPVAYVWDQTDYLGSGIDANAILLGNQWDGIAISNKVYTWNIMGESMDLCYRALDSTNFACLSPLPKDTITNISVIFYNESSYNHPGTIYRYFLYFNSSGIHIFWSNNTSNAPYAPGQIRTRGLGNFSVNSSDNITITYSTNLGQILSFCYEPVASFPGWRNASGYLVGNGINTAKDSPAPADRIDFDASGISYFVPDGTSILSINASYDAPKANLIIGEVPPEENEENISVWSEGVTYRGTDVSDFSVDYINPYDYCLPLNLSGLECYTPLYRGEITFSKAFYERYGPDRGYPHGILLEENISVALSDGFLAYSSKNLSAGETRLLRGIYTVINNTTYRGTESLVINKPGSDIARLVYSEANASDPKFYVQADDEFLTYSISFDKTLPYIWYAGDIPEVPSIRIAGIDYFLTEIRDDYWYVAPEGSEYFTNVYENFTVNTGDFAITVEDIFCYEDYWWASLGVAYGGAYQSRILGSGQTYTYGAENQFGGLEITIEVTDVNEPGNDTIDFLATQECSDCGRLIQAGLNWISDERWTVVSINRNNLTLKIKALDLNVSNITPTLSGYFNLSFLGIDWPESIPVSARAQDDGNMRIDFPSAFGQRQIYLDDIYVEYPNTYVDDTSGAGIKYVENLPNYDAGDPGFTEIDANLLRMNQSKWNGIVIGNRVFYRYIEWVDPNYMFRLCVDQEKEVCPFSIENNTVMEVPVPFYDTKTGIFEGIYSYYFMYNNSGNKNVYIFWSNNTSITPYPPGTLRLPRGGNFSFNTSMQWTQTKANNTLSLTTPHGSTASFLYDPNDDYKGWRNTTPMLGDGIIGNGEMLYTSYMVDYSLQGDAKIILYTNRRDISIESFLDIPKARLFIDAPSDSPKPSATFNSTEAGVYKNGLAINSFEIAEISPKDYCIFDSGYDMENPTFVRSEDDPDMIYDGEWRIRINDVFDDGWGNWYAVFGIWRAGNYQSHAMEEEEIFTFGAEDQFGGYTLTIELNDAWGSYANFSIIE